MEQLYLYLLTIDHMGYDTYDSCIVVAKSEDKAKEISPSKFYEYIDGSWYSVYANGEKERENCRGDWVDDISEINVKKVGKAYDNCVEGEVICASFNAG